jgi:enoyl-CoA hydratase/carnithine racemase
MELAMVCDLVFASDGATFGQPEIRLAAIPPFAVARYEALVGRRRAFADLATGRTFPAKEAWEAGYLTACVPDAELDARVGSAAQELSALSAIALAVLKRAFRREDEAPLAAEQRYVKELAHTPDASEGLRAFLEKRPPRWEGRT